MEEWRTLYERQIAKFDDVDKYILKNLTDNAKVNI